MTSENETSPLEGKFLVFGAWCGVAFSVFVMAGLGLVAGFLPPHAPNADAAAIAEIYQSDFYRIRVGTVLMMFSAAPAMVFAGAMATLVSKIEGKSRVLTYTMLISGMGNALLVFYPALWWLAATFRPDRTIELTFLLNDIAWLQFVGGLFIAWPMNVVLAIAAFVETGEKRYLSRWYGYLCAWVCIILLPAQLIFFVKDGPFAWNGFLAFYFPLTVFFVWLICLVYYIRRAGKRG